MVDCVRLFAYSLFRYRSTRVAEMFHCTFAITRRVKTYGYGETSETEVKIKLLVFVSELGYEVFSEKFMDDYEKGDGLYMAPNVKMHEGDEKEQGRNNNNNQIREDDTLEDVSDIQETEKRESARKMIPHEENGNARARTVPFDEYDDN
jgi:hypothetical protein